MVAVVRVLWPVVMLVEGQESARACVRLDFASGRQESKPSVSTAGSS